MGWIYGRDQSTRLSDHRFSGKRQDLFPELYPAAGLLSDRWKTLLILCEEGEEEYDEEALKQCNTVVESIDSEEELTPERLAAMEILHQPERVIIEYNGMWLVSKFEEMENRKAGAWSSISPVWMQAHSRSIWRI